MFEKGEEFPAIAAAVARPPVTLSDTEIADILAFLASLESPTAKTGRLGIPDTVPSGLEVEK